MILSQIEGVSRIRGIANQRIKECDRIRAVRKNLMKCGIFCKELSDGIEIHGKQLNYEEFPLPSTKKVLIKTYEDHRIAMAFSILGSYFSNMNHDMQIVIENIKCVNKTFPEYWQHINEIFGLDYEGYEIDKLNSKSILVLIIIYFKNNLFKA